MRVALGFKAFVFRLCIKEGGEPSLVV